MSEPIGPKKRYFLLTAYFGLYLFVYQCLLAPYLYKKLGLSGFIVGDGIFNAFLMILFVLLNYDWLKKQWDIYQKAGWKGIWISIRTVLWLYASNLLFSLFVYIPLNLSSAENQINNDMVMKRDPVGFAFSALIVAPFVEEMVFRGCIFHPLAKKKGFTAGALCSGLLFGGIHVLASIETGNWLNLWYLLLYGMCGFVLCDPYAETDSIFAGIIAHSLFNLFSVVLSFL